MNLAERQHIIHLEEIVNNPGIVGVSPKEIKYFIRESTYHPRNSPTPIPFPDLLYVLEEQDKIYGRLYELKHSHKHRGHALKQLRGGHDFLRNELGIPLGLATIVYYNNHKYNFEHFNAEGL